MQTQTNSVCDSSVQTSLEAFSLPPSMPSDKKTNLLEKVIETQTNHQEDNDNEHNSDFERPTKDTSSLNRALLFDDNRKSDEFKSINETKRETSKPIDRSIRPPSHSSTNTSSGNQSNLFSSSSPVRTKSRYLNHDSSSQQDLFNPPLSSQSQKSSTNMSADFTRVSGLNENTPVSVHKVSNSPICFNRSKLMKKPPTSNNNSVSSVSATSSMTTVTAASIESRVTQNPLDQTVLISSSASNKRIQPKTVQPQDILHTANDTNSESLLAEITDEASFIQKEMVESDEILRILLKKTYYYRLKLK